MNAYQIIQKLIDNKYESYFVGGYVRDMILGIPSKDIDICTKARPNEIIKLFNNCNIKKVGKSFGVILVDNIEIVTFRKDNYYGLNDKAVQMKYSDTIIEDLARRDLTINSIAYNPITKEIIDPYNGQNDLKNKIIQFTGDPQKRIYEDPNRIVRCARFLAKIQGKFHVDTLLALQSYSHLIYSHIASERIRLELLKTMELKKPSLFFDALHEIGGLKYIFSHLEKSINFYHGKHHNEDVYDHCMICGDSITSKKPLLRLAGYLHDIGKITSFEDKGFGKRTFYNHEYDGYEWVMNNLMDKLKFSEKETKYIANIIKVHMRGLKQASPKAIRTLLKSLNEKNIRYQDFLRLKIADRKGNLTKNNFSFGDVRGFVKKYRKELNREEEISFIKLAINGHDIMKLLDLKPGKDVGYIKKYLEEVILEHPEFNTKEDLTRFTSNLCTIKNSIINYMKGILGK